MRIDRIPLEAFPGFWVYAYLVRHGPYCVLIDTGSGADSSHEGLISGLREAEVQPADLTHILLTHAHLDHFGGLAKLRPLTAAQVGCHEFDLQTVAHHETRQAEIEQRLATFLAASGLLDKFQRELLSLHGYSKSLYSSTPVDFLYEAIDMRLGPFGIIHLPGHCPGHVAIRIEDVAFCGDMIVEGVTPHLAPASITPFNGLDHFLASLARMQQWGRDVRLFFNGHDDAITDLPAQVESTRRHILRRLGSVLEALHESLTVEQICRSVYGETAGFQQLLVIEKTGAYVEYLYARGFIEIANAGATEQGEPPRYRGRRAWPVMLAELERSIFSNAALQVDTRP